MDLIDVLLAVTAEPELPGDMPDEMWNAIRNDRDACVELLRITVRATKRNIVERITALDMKLSQLKP